jgi:Bacterial Ig-like domain (group 2)
LFSNNTLQLTAQAYDSDFEPVSDTFTWKSSNQSVVEVDPANGLMTAGNLGPALITATSSNNVPGTANAAVANPTFWSGSYQITECDSPGFIGGQTCDAIMDWAVGGPADLHRISFRTGTSESYNFRRDYGNGDDDDDSVANCKADTIAIGSGTSSFTEQTFAEVDYYHEWWGPNSVKYTVTSSTAQAMEGTFSAPYPYTIAQTGSPSDWVFGTLKGTWQAKPLSAPFPKCVPPLPTNLYCTNQYGGIGETVDFATGAPMVIPCAEPFANLTDPYRAGEWQGLP